MKSKNKEGGASWIRKLKEKKNLLKSARIDFSDTPRAVAQKLKIWLLMPPLGLRTAACPSSCCTGAVLLLQDRSKLQRAGAHTESWMANAVLTWACHTPLRPSRDHFLNTTGIARNMTFWVLIVALSHETSPTSKIFLRKLQYTQW